MARGRQSRISEPGSVSDELPLDLPDCFMNGTPYTDCDFKFGRKTGKALKPSQTETYRRLGAALDKMVGAETKKTARPKAILGQERARGTRRRIPRRERQRSVVRIRRRVAR